MGNSHSLRRLCCWLTAGAVGYLWWLGKHESPAERQPSAVAAIDEPELVEAWTRISDLPQFLLMRRGLIRRALDGRVGARVLDVGCGLGQLTLELAAQREVSEAVGIDLSADFVEAARGQSETRGVNARFLEMDAADLSPFSDATFNVIVSTLSLHHWRDPLAALREIKRVLTPGGRVLIVDVRRDIAAPLVGLAAIVSRYVVPEPIRRTGEPLASIKAAFTPVEIALLAAKAGWDEPRVTTGPFWLTLEMG